MKIIPHEGTAPFEYAIVAEVKGTLSLVSCAMVGQMANSRIFRCPRPPGVRNQRPSYMDYKDFVSFGLEISKKLKNTLAWLTPTMQGNIMVSSKSLDELGINMIAVKRGTRPKGASKQVSLESTTQPRICEELAGYVEEFLEVMTDSKQFHIRPTELLYRNASMEEAYRWLADYEQHFEKKELDIQEQGYKAYDYRQLVLNTYLDLELERELYKDEPTERGCLSRLAMYFAKQVVTTIDNYKALDVLIRH